MLDSIILKAENPVQWNFYIIATEIWHLTLSTNSVAVGKGGESEVEMQMQIKVKFLADRPLSDEGW